MASVRESLVHVGSLGKRLHSLASRGLDSTRGPHSLVKRRGAPGRKAAGGRRGTDRTKTEEGAGDGGSHQRNSHHGHRRMRRRDGVRPLHVAHRGGSRCRGAAWRVDLATGRKPAKGKAGPTVRAAAGASRHGCNAQRPDPVWPASLMSRLAARITPRTSAAASDFPLSSCGDPTVILRLSFGFRPGFVDHQRFNLN